MKQEKMRITLELPKVTVGGVFVYLYEDGLIRVTTKQIGTDQMNDGSVIDCMPPAEQEEQK